MASGGNMVGEGLLWEKRVVMVGGGRGDGKTRRGSANAALV